jgi:hypothetical protein
MGTQGQKGAFRQDSSFDVVEIYVKAIVKIPLGTQRDFHLII